MTVLIPKVADARIHVLPPNGEQGSLLTIHRDGRVSFGPEFTTIDAAALEFWTVLERLVKANTAQHRRDDKPEA